MGNHIGEEILRRLGRFLETLENEDSDMKAKKDKSLLDGMKVKEEGAFFNNSSQFKLLTVVSQCPKCGSPIYGSSTLAKEDEVTLRRTCSCTPR